MKPKRMESIEIYISNEGDICLKNDDYGDGPQVVSFSPEQADTVIAWIKEAKEAAKNLVQKSE
jgi:hypothetical protein